MGRMDVNAPGEGLSPLFGGGVCGQRNGSSGTVRGPLSEPVGLGGTIGIDEKGPGAGVICRCGTATRGGSGVSGLEIGFGDGRLGKTGQPTPPGTPGTVLILTQSLPGAARLVLGRLGLGDGRGRGAAVHCVRTQAECGEPDMHGIGISMHCCRGDAAEKRGSTTRNKSAAASVRLIIDRLRPNRNFRKCDPPAAFGSHLGVQSNALPANAMAGAKAPRTRLIIDLPSTSRAREIFPSIK